jgi:HSP20 family protein
MANIVRRGEASAPAGLARGEWDPFRLMRDVLRWDPFGEMAPFAGPTVATFNPDFEVKETDKAYVFKADLPGIEEKNLDIAVTGNRLTISGKRDVEEKHEGETYYAYERNYGSFTRAFTLPDGVDAEHVQAELKNGVLTMHLPKLPELQPKKIEIKGLAAKQSGRA